MLNGAFPASNYNEMTLEMFWFYFYIDIKYEYCNKWRQCVLDFYVIVTNISFIA